MGARINLLGPGIGAEVLGVDVRDLDDSAFATIYEAWLAHGVIAIRGQHLCIEAFLEHGRRYGRLHEHPSKATRHPEHPELTVMGIGKFHPDGSLNRAVYARGGESWHTDGAYDRTPFKATALYALAIPSRGGDTLFASMYRAYERLPEALKARLEGLEGAFTYGGRSERSSALLDPQDRAHPPARHALVKVHPETGRRSLYFDPGKILHIEGLSSADSDALIDELTARMVEEAEIYRHRWREGDFVIWDNRCLAHRAAADYPPEEDRIHWRISIKSAEVLAEASDLGAG